MQREWRDQANVISGEVDEEVICETVSKMTGIPLTRIDQGESERLLKMEDELHRRVISQDEAIGQIARAMRRSRAGLKNPKRPIGSFLFVGPTGVGKTLLCKALAEFMFGSEDSLVQIDMSEYMEKFNVSRLVGAPPGYVGYEEGGQLTEKIRRRPYAVVLMDEIEKAHPDVYNMLLQVMEEGQLTDSFGRVVDFKNVVLILTSNIGANIIKNQTGLGFVKKDDESRHEKMREMLMHEIERHFKPEFLNRLDEIIVFKPLNKEDLYKTGYYFTVEITYLDVGDLEARATGILGGKQEGWSLVLARGKLIDAATGKVASEFEFTESSGSPFSRRFENDMYNLGEELAIWLVGRAR
jgi:ATP-dependent Clp protease ATP-binding subunit ClpC